MITIFSLCVKRWVLEFYMILIIDLWEGVLLIFQFNCRPWATPPLMAKKALKERLDVPVLVVEGDIYDTRNYSAGQLKTRIESFAEVLKAKKLEQAA